jgi:hypothetical protein
MFCVRLPLVCILSMLGLGVLLAAPTDAADLVIYRTLEGRLVLSNRPLPSGVELFFRVPDHNQPAPQSEDGAAARGPSRQALVPAPPILQEQVPRPRATTVDTVALALITRGMPAADVRGTLGVPERIVPLDPVVRVSSDRSSATAGHLERSVWVYPSTAPGGSVCIWLVNGYVERVERLW